MSKKQIIMIQLLMGLIIILSAYNNSFGGERDSETKWITHNKKINGLCGKLVLAAEDEDGVSVLYTLNLESGSKKKLYRHNDTTNLHILWPHWSKDGTRIYFYGYRTEKQRWCLWSIRTDGTDVKEEKTVEHVVSKSCRSKFAKMELTTKAGNIYLDGKEIIHFGSPYDSKYNSGYNYPAFSPDGRWIILEKYYATRVPTTINFGWGELKHEIWIFSLDGGQKLKIIEGNAQLPDWFISK